MSYDLTVFVDGTDWSRKLVVTQPVDEFDGGQIKVRVGSNVFVGSPAGVRAFAQNLLDAADEAEAR